MDGSLFLQEVLKNSEAKRPSVAYVGASNGDNVDFYGSIFQPAMHQAHAGDCRLVPRYPNPDILEFFKAADVVLLAGGDVELGWRSFEENGFEQLIREQFLAGVLLVGISAGAVQLGRGGLWRESSALLSTFGLLPFYVGAHEEHNDWTSLRTVISLAGNHSCGIGIPSGGAISYCAGELKSFVHAAVEMVRENGGFRERLLVPEAERQ